jgi:hypothetical protein
VTHNEQGLALRSYALAPVLSVHAPLTSGRNAAIQARTAAAALREGRNSRSPESLQQCHQCMPQASLAQSPGVKVSVVAVSSSWTRRDHAEKVLCAPDQALRHAASKSTDAQEKGLARYARRARAARGPGAQARRKVLTRKCGACIRTHRSRVERAQRGTRVRERDEDRRDVGGERERGRTAVGAELAARLLRVGEADDDDFGLDILQLGDVLIVVTSLQALVCKAREQALEGRGAVASSAVLWKRVACGVVAGRRLELALSTMCIRLCNESYIQAAAARLRHVGDELVAAAGGEGLDAEANAADDTLRQAVVWWARCWQSVVYQ